MSKVKEQNYVVIQGWMLSKLQLKGNDLLIYAIIYGFSQNTDCKFTGSLQYLADWTNSTKQGVLNSLKNLLDKKLITKKDYIINGVKFVEYYSNDFNEVVKKVEQGYSNDFNGGSQETLPNNTNDKLIDNSINNKDKDTASGFSSSQSSMSEIPNNSTSKQYEKEFEDFYEAFEGKHPTKQPKRAKSVYSKWKLAIKTHTPEAILKAIQDYADYLSVATWRKKKDVIAWLNGAMYEVDWKQETLQEQQKSNKPTFNNQNANTNTVRDYLKNHEQRIRSFNPFDNLDNL
jgi:predicted transcriptional regulator